MVDLDTIYQPNGWSGHNSRFLKVKGEPKAIPDREIFVRWLTVVVLVSVLLAGKKKTEATAAAPIQVAVIAAAVHKVAVIAG